MALRLVCGLALVCGLVCVLSAGAVHAAGPSLSSAPISGVVPPRGAVHNTSPIGPDNLSYNGGPVMHSNTTYAIYWLPPGYSYGSSASNYESTINQFFTDVAHDSGGHANVYSTDPQYYDTVGGGYHYADYSSTFAGSVVDTNAFPASGCTDPSSLALPVCLTQNQELNEVYNVITAQGWPIGDSSIEYFLFTPQNVTSCSGSECAYTQFCAYHTYFTVGGSPVVWANQPWTSGINSCDTGTHPNASDADPTINVVSHEHNEAITDPLLNAWYDSGGNENGDKCAWTFGTLNGSSNQTINGHSYLLQEEWDNSGSQCLQGFTPPTPTVSSLSPTGGAAGATVTINGTGFVSPSAVKFNGKNASSFTIVSPTQLTATPAAGTTSGPVSVVTPGGTATSSGDFTIAPTITSFTPTSGAPGTSVTIDGTSFTGATTVTFNGTPAESFTVDSDTQITATVGPGTTTGAVAVTNAGGTATSSTDFTVVAPVVTSFAPTSGGTGTSVTVTGSGFTGVTGVTFGGVDAADFALVSDTELTATVPIGAVTGPVAVTTLGGTGSSAGDFTVIPAPTLTGFTPTSGAVGTTVTLTGTGLTGATAVAFNGTPASSFTVDTDTQISAVVAAGTTSGTVSVTAPGGTATSSGSFTVTPSPSPDGFLPATGWTGTHVTIQGSYLQTATGVSFNGTPAASFNVESSSMLNAYVAAGTTSGPITVTFPSGAVTLSGTFTMVPPPTLTDVSPASGTVGTTLTLTGTNLATATRVDFTGSFSMMTSFTVDSDTQITVAVPSGATTGTLSVTTPSGVAAAPSPFTVITQPTVTSFTPSSGGPGASVSITGTGLTGAIAVKFNGTDAASFVVSSDTQIVATVPATVTSGPISVTNAAGTGTSSGTFTFVPPPTISSFSPTDGPPGTSVTITGTNLTGATAVEFNGTAASSYSVVSATEITATVPTGATSGTIAVTTPGGTATSSTDFTFYPPAEIMSFSPSGGPVGTTVTLTGSGFTGATAVSFNGTPATSFTVDSDTQVTAVVPTGATSGVISIVAPGGTGTSGQSFTVGAVTISRLNPGGCEPGCSVTVTGTGFTGATSVQFNGTEAASFSVDSDTQITAVVPVHSTTGPVSVATPLGTGTTSFDFTVFPAPPQVTTFSPSSGVAGDSVTITGQHFTDATTVQFNGTDAVDFSVDSDTQITATVPDGAGAGPITVTTPDGTSTSSGTFTVYEVPSIGSFSPDSGRSGDQVTITGLNFTGLTDVKFDGTAATWQLDSDTQITATVPAGATSGTISVTTAGGSATSSESFTVYTSPAPVVSSFSPAKGKVGTTVTIRGQNLAGADSVSFAGVSALPLASTATTVTVLVPSGATSGKLDVTTPTGGTGESAATFWLDPVVSSFSPDGGPDGTRVTILGSGFDGATAVKFNTTNADSFTVVDDGKITATVAPGTATGYVTVTTPAGSARSLTKYAADEIRAVSPAKGKPGTSVTLTGVGFTGTTTVKFGGTPAASFVVFGDTRIVAVVAAGTTNGPVTVTSPAGTMTSAVSFGVPAAIDSFSPGIAPAGTTITILGSGFTGATAVKVNTTAATDVVVVNDGKITATIAEKTTSGYVSVTTPGGTARSSTRLTIVGITGFSPTRGAPGSTVTIVGSGLSGATGVKFNGLAAASFKAISDTRVTAVVADGTTSGPITVATSHGAATSVASFGIVPHIDSFDPTEAAAGATVTVHGSGFTGATAVKIGGTPADNVDVVNDGKITAKIDAKTRSGVITVSTPYGVATSATKLQVAGISSFTPGRGSAGTTVTISGSGLTGATAVRFNGADAASYDVVSDTKVTAVVAAGTTSGPITVVTPSGTVTSAGSFAVVAKLDSFDPAEGAVGATVTIAGSGFTGATAVKINGKPADALDVVGDGEITAKIASGTTSGYVSVTTPSGTVTSKTKLTVVAVASFTPARAAVGATVTIYGSGLAGATAVTFDGIDAASFKVVSDTRVTAVVPAGAKSGTIGVVTPSGTLSSPASFGVVAVVQSFSPASAAPGQTVTITGSGFTDETAVTIGGVAASSVTVVDDSHITVTVPAGAKTGRIAVRTGGGTTSSGQTFHLVALAPSTGGDGGTKGNPFRVSIWRILLGGR